MINLERYLIPAMESDKTEPGSWTSKIRFFNKAWDVKISYHHTDNKETRNLLKSFHEKSASISSKIEKEFCRICNLFNQDPSYTGIPADSIKKYSDVKDLSLTHISFFKDSGHSNNIVLILQGKYVIDDEHGWSIGICNGMWDGTIRAFSSDYYDYLDSNEDSSYAKYQKSKRVKLF